MINTKKRMIRENELKKCFVIAPIGDERSETKQRSDQILNYVIKPVAEECCGYQVTRADQISKPGIITSHIIQHLINDELVIADLTGRNPNVFYELAVRHVIKKPVIQIIEFNESIPFDVAPIRTIRINHRNLDSVADCKKELTKQIHSIEESSSEFNSPFSIAVDLQLLSKSENPLARSNLEIISKLQEIHFAISNLKKEAMSPEVSYDVLNTLTRVYFAYYILEDCVKKLQKRKITKTQVTKVVQDTLHVLGKQINKVIKEMNRYVRHPIDKPIQGLTRGEMMDWLSDVFSLRG